VEDTAYREYLVKLKEIHKNMYTVTGRELAQTRNLFMVQFFDQLNQEIYCNESELLS
jgi:HD superfamily phosphodiesterase